MSNADAASTQQHSFTEEEVSQLYEEVRELAQQVVPKEELQGAFEELDSELQEMSDLQERGDYLQEMLGALQEAKKESEDNEGGGGQRGQPPRPPLDTLRRLLSKTASGAAAAASDATAAAKGLNDNAHGIDRFGYRPLAQALAAMLKRAEPPICVGLYARWGAGKTFMISLLKREFDETVYEDPHTHRLLQFFEKGYKPAPKQAPAEQTVGSLIYNLLITILLTFLPPMPYGVATLCSITCDAFDPRNTLPAAGAWCSRLILACSKLMRRCIPGAVWSSCSETLRAVWAWWCSGLKRSCARWKSSCAKTVPCFSYNKVPKDQPKAARGQKEVKTKQKKEVNREFIFVDFNAWEFAESDALWAGLVRGVYLKTEERITAGKMELNKKDKCFESTDNSKDFKREWRVKRAKMLLTERFGLPLIRMAIAYAVVFLLALAALIVVETTQTTRIVAELYASAASSIETALAAITGLLAAVAAIVPSFKLAFASNKESNVSRGDVIFKQASAVRDQLGFLEMVKRELQELFDYLREFEEQVGTRIILVPIIDDLDRCITDGRNVKVLEAMQLLLSVPGAPIISFLAVDSRIVVASIEEHYAKVFEKTNISGLEYLDKIVQLPFALPEPPPEKVKRLLSKSLEGNAASLVQVAQRLKVFGSHGRKLVSAQAEALDKAKYLAKEDQLVVEIEHTQVQPQQAAPVTLKKVLIFKVSPSVLTPVEIAVPLKPLILAVDAFESKSLLPGNNDEENSLELVCAVARKLGNSKLPDQITLMVKEGNMDKEAVEILCRETNAALEAGNIVFEEVEDAPSENKPREQAAELEYLLVPALLRWEDGVARSQQDVDDTQQAVAVAEQHEAVLSLITPATARVKHVHSLTIAAHIAQDDVSLPLTAVQDDGSLPLHIAARIQGADMVVASLLVAHPNGAKERDLKGNLPLHIAAMRQQQGGEVVSLLLEAYREGAKEPQNDAHGFGKLPFDLALDAGCQGNAALLASGAWNKGFDPLDQPLVTTAESKVFESLAHLLDPNPRRLKRIISVYALVTEVAQRMPLSEGNWKNFVKDDSQWAGFRPKLAKWLCLCEMYPYRMSFLILVIMDLVQKTQVNQLRRKHPAIQDYGLVHYGKDGGKTIETTPDAKDESGDLQLPDGMPIVEAYFRHVERYIYSHPKARKMLSLDGDPELLTALLMQPVANLAAAEDNKGNSPETCDITVADILGPLNAAGSGADYAVDSRDANFSLLSYSFSLNPALRYELSFEMGQMQSDTSLHFGIDTKSPGSSWGYQLPAPVLHKDQKCLRKDGGPLKEL